MQSLTPPSAPLKGGTSVRPSLANVTTPHPKVDIPKNARIDQVADHLEALWEARMGDEFKAVIGIPVQPGWKPLQPVDDVLEIADGIMDSGGLPRLIYKREQDAETDGTFLPGGIDVHPQYYNEKIGPGMDPNEPDKAFDELEIGLIRDHVAQEKPFAAACRGMQITNVALGGSLYQDIPTEFPDQRVDHRPEATRHDLAKRDTAVHLIVNEPGSRIFEAVGELDAVNSVHHQGVKDLSPLLRVTSIAPDGMVEGVEVKGNPAQNGYQFHPESLRYGDPDYQQIFDNLVNDAAEWRKERANE